MPQIRDFQTVFHQLRQILKKYESHLVVQSDSRNGYSLNVTDEYHKNQNFFGAVQIQKSYVSYYLMPVYLFPDLLEGISDDLKKRMQGKSCFNFKTADPTLVKELTRLTKKSFDRFKQQGLV